MEKAVYSSRSIVIIQVYTSIWYSRLIIRVPRACISSARPHTPACTPPTVASTGSQIDRVRGAVQLNIRQRKPVVPVVHFARTEQSC